jgi:ribosomal protein L37AE/L43A
MGQERQAGEMIPCQVCHENPVKVNSKGVLKCYHCWLGNRFNVLYPKGIQDEKDTEVWKENLKRRWNEEVKDDPQFTVKDWCPLEDVEK